MELWRRLVDHDPSNSRAVVGLMEALESIGERGAALEQAAQHAALLRVEFDAEPDVEVQACADRLETRSESARATRRGLARDNLPRQPTALVGRVREIAALKRMIEESTSGLITLTGPGGAGKTRLAIHVAGEVRERFPDGVFFVNLGFLQDAALVGVTLARTIGVPLRPGADVGESLLAGLYRRRMLLVLDGFETVLPAADLVALLLEETETLVVVATSRAILQLRGERVFQCRPSAFRSERRRWASGNCSGTERSTCSSSGPGRRIPSSSSRSTIATRSPGSARGWTVFRWPSSWRRRGSGCSSPPCSSLASDSNSIS